MSNTYVDLTEMPAMFGRCLKTDCPLGETCLRRLAMLQEEKRTQWLTVVNPASLTADAADCPFHIDAHHPTHAKGLTYNLKEVPLGKAEAIKDQLERKFGRMKLSRMKRGLCLITPQDQETLASIFERHEAPIPTYKLMVHPWELG